MATRQFKLSKHAGFSLVEVLVAFSILLIILMAVLQSRISSVRRIEETGDLNQIQDIVRADLANIRKEALKWKCQPGTACTGSANHRNNPPRYVDLVPPENVDPVDLDSPSHYCNKEDPLTGFKESIPELNNNQNKNIAITRSMTINSENRKQLDITYEGKAGDRAFDSSASIIPEAMNWCS